MATNGASLADMEDTTTLSLGLGQKLSSQWGGFIAVSYDRKTETSALSALRPSNGRVGYTLGVNYKDKAFDITPWISYQRLGAADIFLASQRIGSFGQSSALAAGIKLGYSF